MTAPTAQEIESAALASLANFPTVARLVQAGDPRVLAQIRAQAAMLAMLAEQVDVAQFEAFVKSRDSTVLADATLKGVLPLARSCRVSLTVTNGDTVDYVMQKGRRLLDAKGRLYMVDSDVTVKAGLTATVAATQKTVRDITHTVLAPAPFYRMEVTNADADTYLASLQVLKGAYQFTYAPDWFNVLPGDLAYQVETDERRRLFVCMGQAGVVGYGVQVGDTFTLEVEECEGRIADLQLNSSFNLEYILTNGDGQQKITLAAITDSGSAPHSVSELRVMSQYPSIYDHNAVYLGEFAFLLRRYISGIQFLSVWNEQVEESVRGANVANVNKLFVAGRVTGMDDATFQARASELIKRADDSYKIVFVPVVDKPIPVSITGAVSVVHDRATVTAQVRGAMLAEFGVGSPTMSVGMSNPLRVQAATKLLKDQITAFQDDISDFAVTITQPASPKPEEFLQVTDVSLTVTISGANYNGGLWNR